MSVRVTNDVWLERCFAAFLLAGLLLTNRYVSLDTDGAWLRFVAGDVPSYLAIAEAFPGRPRDTLPRHHAERFVIPYVLGGVARTLGLPVGEVFRAFALLVVLGVVAMVHRIVRQLAISHEMRLILLALLILNTYMFRYYLAIPWMVSDLGFHLGVGLVLLALFEARPSLLLAGLATAGVSKQTALALVPGVIAWLWLQWTAPRRTRIALCVGVAALVLLVYQAISWLAEPFSGRSVVALHVTGLVRWMATRFSLPVLVDFFARGLVPFVLPSALLLSLVMTRALPGG